MSEYVHAIQVVVVVDESERNLEADVGLVNVRILVSVDEYLYILAPK